MVLGEAMDTIQYLNTFIMLQIKQFVFNDFQENTYVLWDDQGQCMLVDPGCYTLSEQQTLKTFIELEQLKPVLLVNTHCHIDHVLGNEFVMQTWNLPLHLHPKELQTYRETSRWADVFGMNVNAIPTNLVFIDETKSLLLGRYAFELLLTPGHSIASMSFYQKESNLLLAGDVLFHRSIGRTDLPGGNLNVLLNSIETQFWNLPENCVVYSGHGSQTTIGEEKLYNPFLNS